jgi:hypothetical protein
MTLSGIEPATFRLVASYPNQLRYRVTEMMVVGPRKSCKQRNMGESGRNNWTKTDPVVLVCLQFYHQCCEWTFPGINSFWFRSDGEGNIEYSFGDILQISVEREAYERISISRPNIMWILNPVKLLRCHMRPAFALKAALYDVRCLPGCSAV